MLQSQVALLRSPLLAPALATSGRLCLVFPPSFSSLNQRDGHRRASRAMASSPEAGTPTAADGAAAAGPAGAASSSALWQAITERYDAAQRGAAATMTETNTG